MNIMGMTFYVYELVDPETEKPFYIGKGVGDRMYHHGRPSDKVNDEKIAKIKKIGYDNVIRRKIKEFTDEQAAYAYESVLINSTPGLTNGKSNVVTLMQMIRVLFDSLHGDKKQLIDHCKKTLELFPFVDQYLDAHRLLLSIPKKILESNGYEVKYYA